MTDYRKLAEERDPHAVLATWQRTGGPDDNDIVSGELSIWTYPRRIIEVTTGVRLKHKNRWFGEMDETLRRLGWQTITPWESDGLIGVQVYVAPRP